MRIIGGLLGYDACWLGGRLSSHAWRTRAILAHLPVKTHVSWPLDKLVLKNRAQAAILAYEMGIVELGSR